MSSKDKENLKKTILEERTNFSKPYKEDLDIDIDDLIPTMNIDADSIMHHLPVDDTPSIIEDEKILGLYDEILDNCRKDRESVDEMLVNFTDLVLNDGDASSASKEAIVNLIKIKSDTSDKMSKVADLMTRIKLKDKDTFPRYLAAQQNNQVIIEKGNNKREMIKSMNKVIEGKKNDK